MLSKRNGSIKRLRKQVIAKLKPRDSLYCSYCDRRLQVVNPRNRADYMTLDHVIPLCKGGSNYYTNIVISCIECNTRKGGDLPK